MRLLYIFGLAVTVSAVSTISLFSRDDCQTWVRDLTGPDGYPSGTCSSLQLDNNLGSFHIDNLDPGCVVTLYRQNVNSSTCSGARIVAAVGACYTAEFQYYSIDECSGQGTPSPAPSSQAAQTSTASLQSDIQSLPSTFQTSSLTPVSNSSSPLTQAGSTTATSQGTLTTPSISASNAPPPEDPQGRAKYLAEIVVPAILGPLILVGILLLWLFKFGDKFGKDSISIVSNHERFTAEYPGGPDSIPLEALNDHGR